MHQISIQTPLRPEEVTREHTLGGAIELCAKAAGFTIDKQINAVLGIDKAQWSRWRSNIDGIKWEKLNALMDTFGNDAPLMWMLAQRGYDLHSLRKLETETERALRQAHERNATLELKLQTLTDALRGVTP